MTDLIERMAHALKGTVRFLQRLDLGICERICSMTVEEDIWAKEWEYDLVHGLRARSKLGEETVTTYANDELRADQAAEYHQQYVDANEKLIETQAEKAILEDEVAKLRQRLSTREKLRERIAQLNTKLAMANAVTSSMAVLARNSYIKDLVIECDHFSKKADALAAENARLREALAIKDPITELYRKSWEITRAALKEK